jgi:hypothetical protein
MQQRLKKLEKLIKKELKQNEKKRQWCRQRYPDWEDDEFNMLECKFIWGIPYESEKEPSFLTLNKAQIYYNRETDLYYLDIDLPEDTSAAWDEIARLDEIKSGFEDFLIKNNLRMLAKIPYFYGPEFQFSLDGRSPTELYTKFRCMYEGYKWYKQCYVERIKGD